MRFMLLPAALLFFASCNSEAPQSTSGAAPPAVSAADNGMAIFRQNCTTCHMLDKDATGPKLQGVLTLWNNDSAQLKAFIHDPAGSIAAGNPLAKQAQQRGGGAVMPSFPNLSDDDLNSLIAYFQNGR